jgi:hypothetical protein
LCEAYHHNVIFENNPSDHENMIHSMPCRNLCRLYIHLAFTYFVGPSSIVWSELGPAPPFPPMRVLEVYWLHALSLMCGVALNSWSSLYLIVLFN